MTAKHLLAQVVRDWVQRGGPQPRILRECRGCYKEGSQPLPADVKEAAVEHALPSGRIADIALLDGNTVRAAVEIRVSNAVSEEKAQDIGCRWLELAADEVLLDPLSWRPLREGLRPYTCRECREERARQRTEVASVAEGLGIDLPPNPPYRSACHDCWKCNSRIIVFAWDQGMHSSDPPPQPAPKSIRFKKTAEVPEGYWANNCQRCHVVQGDFYLHACEGLFPDRDEEPIEALPR